MTLDQFFKECAVWLGKSQVEFENEYYVMDLFDVLDAKRKMDAENWFMQLNIEMIPQTTDGEDVRKFITSLHKMAGYEAKPATFDKARFEQLKMELKMGI